MTVANSAFLNSKGTRLTIENFVSNKFESRGSDIAVLDQNSKAIIFDFSMGGLI